MKKIGTVTYYNIFNYGSFLQAYAFQKKLEALGYKPEILEIKYENTLFSKLREKVQIIGKLMIWPQYITFFLNLRKMGKASIQNIEVDVQKKFREAIDKNLIVHHCSLQQIEREAKREEYQCFVCGSDQIWSPLGIVVKKHKFLEFAPKEKRIAYAPSLGVEYIPRYNRKAFKKKMSDMAQISVRENSGRKIIEELLNVQNVPVVLDPTLLWDKDFWNRNTVEWSEKKKYLCCYFLNEPTPEQLGQISEFARKKELTIVVMPYKNKLLEIENAKFASCSPFEFLGVIKNAAYVLTDSYHGTIFSIQFEKKFLSFERSHHKKVRQVSRLLTLLDNVGLTYRFVNIEKWEEIIDTEINYTSVKSEIQKMYNFSMNYLINAIKSVEKYEPISSK